MTPKPITPERRTEILSMDTWFSVDWYAVFLELLAAEQYWREAVRNAAESICLDGFDFFCQFCQEKEEHRPDCPYLLAQESPPNIG